MSAKIPRAASLKSGAESEFIDVVSRLGTSIGLNRAVGQIYGLLYLRAEPLSLDEIAQSLKISKGGASVNIRELENWGAVKAVWVPGSRKDYYAAAGDVLGLVYSRMRIRFEKTLSELGGNLDKWEKNLSFSDDGRLSGKMAELRGIKTALDSLVRGLPREIDGKQMLRKISAISKIKNLLF